MIWDAKRYDEDFSYVHRYGKDVVQLVDKGSGLAVDLGCGAGALLPALKNRGYRVIGVDASPQMIQIAKEKNPQDTFLLADACEFDLPEKADVIFSNAVFHWIPRERQDALAANISRQLKPGGRLVCEFGGYRCGANVYGTLEKCFAKRGFRYPREKYFPKIGKYVPLIERHGLLCEYAVLFERPTPLQTENGLRDWIHMFAFAPFADIASETGQEILTETEKLLRNKLYKDSKWFIDYVRIRVKAVKI